MDVSITPLKIKDYGGGGGFYANRKENTVDTEETKGGLTPVNIDGKPFKIEDLLSLENNYFQGEYMEV